MVFLLVVLWRFSKGSERFHTWLYTHRISARRSAYGANTVSFR